MTIDLHKPRTVRFSANARAGSAYRSSYEVDLEKFLPVHRALRDYLDVDPARSPFHYSVHVFSDLVAAGWDREEARRYAQAARLACEENLDPATGEPLVGIAAVHPVHAETAVDQIVNILADNMPATKTPDEEEMAWRIVDRMVGLGWMPTA